MTSTFQHSRKNLWWLKRTKEQAGGHTKGASINQFSSPQTAGVNNVSKKKMAWFVTLHVSLFKLKSIQKKITHIIPHSNHTVLNPYCFHMLHHFPWADLLLDTVKKLTCSNKWITIDQNYVVRSTFVRFRVDIYLIVNLRLQNKINRSTHYTFKPVSEYWTEKKIIFNQDQ